MNFHYFCHTDQGNVREKNEDALLVKCGRFSGENCLIACVCDGVGGLEQGEMASFCAVKILSDWFDMELPQLEFSERIIKKRLQVLIESINSEIYYHNKVSGIKSGTTFSCILFRADRYTVCHIGDSRIYRIGSTAGQLTEDHSWIAREVREGRMTEAEAEADQRKNVILKCLGAGPEIEADIFSGQINAPSVFLLCSDGFWHYLTKPEIEKFLSPDNFREGTLRELAEADKRRGETDNISAVAVRIDEGDEKSR